MKLKHVHFAILGAVLAVASAPAASAPVSAADGSSLNAKVCNNISLTERERASCTNEMKTARTEEDQAKVRKEYEDKIVAARARKSHGG